MSHKSEGKNIINDGTIEHGGTRAFLNRVKNRRRANKTARAARKRNR